MNIKYLLYTLTAIFSVMFSPANAQCGITNVTLNDVECSGDAYYDFDLNFIISGNTLDSFDIYINENYYGRFGTDELPVHVSNNTFSGYQTDTVTVSDPQNPDCKEAVTVDNPCGCSIFEFTYSKMNCTDTTFYMVVDFKHFNTLDSFALGYEDNYLGTYHYSQLPIVVGPLVIKDTVIDLFVTNIDTTFDCFTDVFLPLTPCEDTCTMKGLEFLGYECTGSYTKDISLALAYNNPGKNGYDIYLNDSLYEHKDYQFSSLVDSVTIIDTIILYDIDIDCDSTLQVYIVDSEKEGCDIENTFDSLCCTRCSISGLEVSDIHCVSDTTYAMILDFDFQDNRNDSFAVYFDNQLYGRFHTGQLPLALDSLPCVDVEFTYLWVELDNGGCTASLSYVSPLCSYYGCNLGKASYQIVFDSISKYWVVLDLEDYNHTSEKFQIKGQEEDYGTFAYDSLPVRLGPFNCADSLFLHFELTDTANDTCVTIVEPGVITCPVGTFDPAKDDKAWSITKGTGNELIISSQSAVLHQATIQLYDLQGHKILHTQLPGGLDKTTIHLNGLPSGIYLAHLITSNKSYVKKIFLE